MPVPTSNQRHSVPTTSTRISTAARLAFFDATGVGIRETPMTPVRVRSELEAAVAEPGLTAAL